MLSLFAVIVEFVNFQKFIEELCVARVTFIIVPLLKIFRNISVIIPSGPGITCLHRIPGRRVATLLSNEPLRRILQFPGIDFLLTVVADMTAELFHAELGSFAIDFLAAGYADAKRLLLPIRRGPGLSLFLAVHAQISSEPLPAIICHLLIDRSSAAIALFLRSINAYRVHSGRLRGFGRFPSGLLAAHAKRPFEAFTAELGNLIKMQIL